MDRIAATELELSLPQEEAIEHVVKALAAEGFGVLTRVDLDQAFGDKLGIAFRPYTILGACHPRLAHQAVSAVSEVGLLLPCNVTVESAADEVSTVRIIDPAAMMTVGGLGDNPVVAGVAEEARAALERVALSLQEEA